MPLSDRMILTEIATTSTVILQGGLVYLIGQRNWLGKYLLQNGGSNRTHP